MEIYFFFKRFFVWLGMAPAKALHARGRTPNEASALAAALLVPLVALLAFVPSGVAFWAYLAVLLLVKLVANAVDGILARLRGDSSRAGMVWNVSTDIVPDMVIAAVVLFRIGVPDMVIAGVLAVGAAYLASELFFIFRFGMQNVYFGKDLRTFFFVVIAGFAFLSAHRPDLPLPSAVFPLYYGMIFFLHQLGYFRFFRDRMALRVSPAGAFDVRARQKPLR